MSIHKLTAGSGYDYLTRQVAAFDATAKGHIGLAPYYAARVNLRVSGSAREWSESTACGPATK